MEPSEVLVRGCDAIDSDISAVEAALGKKPPEKKPSAKKAKKAKAMKEKAAAGKEAPEEPPVAVEEKVEAEENKEESKE